MLAVRFAVVPTVSLRTLSCMSPSTVPSINPSSLPEIPPFTCRLDPSRAAGVIASLLKLGVPSETPERALVIKSFAHVSVLDPQLAAYPVFPPSNPP
jgi:hypothetical protein